MMQQSRRQLLIKAVQDAAIELAAKANHARYATFELYPPPKPKPEMLAISGRAIFELVRRKSPT